MNEITVYEAKPEGDADKELEEYRAELQRLVEVGIRGAAKAAKVKGSGRATYSRVKPNWCACGMDVELLPNGMPTWGCSNCIARDRRLRDEQRRVVTVEEAPRRPHQPSRFSEIYK